jgi:hypothetical protein
MNIHSRWLVGVALIVWASLAQAAFHLFRLDQLYSNADGSIQFVVIREGSGSNNENQWDGITLRATPAGGAPQTFTFPSNLPSTSTANRKVLVATPGFAALGIVTPDFVMPANFLPINGGTVNYAGVSQITYAALPTDGVNALSSNGAMVPNVATNFFGATGSVVPSAAIPTALVIEYYNASLDHYFITHLATEIAILDAGVTIKGWVRTGQSFNVYAAAGAGTSPVCRFYIPPDKGDSHFFGRGTAECDATALKNPTFVNEDPQFFHVMLPAAGVCPGGTIPVYRVFSNRPDANHRYMINAAIRDLMVSQQHWLAEGDGPDLVVMCVPPTPSTVAPTNPPPAPPMPPEPPEPPGYGPYP